MQAGCRYLEAHLLTSLRPASHVAPLAHSPEACQSCGLPTAGTTTMWWTDGTKREVEQFEHYEERTGDVRVERNRLL